MTINSFNKLYKEIMKLHSWHSGLSLGKFTVKYIDFSIDSRTGDIWSLRFRHCSNFNSKKWSESNNREVFFRELNNYSLEDQVNAFLADCMEYNNTQSKGAMIKP